MGSPSYPDLFIRSMRQRDLVTINHRYQPIFKAIADCGKDDFTYGDVLDHSDQTRTIVSKKIARMVEAGVLVRTSRTREGKLFKYSYKANYLKIPELFLELEAMFSTDKRRVLALDSLVVIGPMNTTPLMTLLSVMEISRSSTEIHRFLGSEDGKSLITKEYISSSGAPVVLHLTDRGKRALSIIQTLSYSLRNLDGDAASSSL